MPQRPGTDNTASAQTLGDVVAEMRFMRGLHMPAELLRTTAPNHPFATQAARTLNSYQGNNEVHYADSSHNLLLIVVMKQL